MPVIADENSFSPAKPRARRVSFQGTVPPPAPDALVSKTRLPSIDALRGLVMILMALDHVRDFFHTGAMAFQPDDLTRTTPILFFTRWITHFCAPVFMFTAGVSAWLWLSRGRNKQHLTRFLYTRGLWLILLDLTVVRMAFTLGSGPVLVSILWALGWSMVILALLVHLPARLLAFLSLAVIVLHNLADSVKASRFGAFCWIWNVLHQSGVVHFGGLFVIVGYPLVPWFAVMAAGFCFARILTFDAPRRQRWTMRIGLASLLAFFLIRAINVYGDPAPWSGHAFPAVALSFLKCTKYPPSLDFLLMTLGPALLVLAVLDRLRFSVRNPLIVFGRVPLFYFLVHLYVIHALAILLALLRYGHADFMLNPLPSMGGAANLYPPHYGYSLGVVYLLWAIVVTLLYPPCLWFSRLKSRRRDWWLSYL